MPEQTKEQLQSLVDTFQALVSYLLYEREEETEVRSAFAALVGERHCHFHADGDETSDFTRCGNEVCVKALQILQKSKEKKIEINEFTLQLLANFSLKVMKSGRSCIAMLEQKSQIIPPGNGVTLEV